MGNVLILCGSLSDIVGEESNPVVAVEAELARAKAEPHKDVPYLKALKSLITALTELSQKEADFTAKKTELEVGHLQ